MEPSFEHFVIPDEELKSIDLKTCININIGVMGHIDSGKTSLSRALTRITSTAALDKNPQSKERGITLDLGFSAFFLQNSLLKDSLILKSNIFNSLLLIVLVMLL